jgi:hypothetical protein
MRSVDAMETPMNKAFPQHMDVQPFSIIIELLKMKKKKKIILFFCAH